MWIILSIRIRTYCKVSERCRLIMKKSSQTKSVKEKFRIRQIKEREREKERTGENSRLDVVGPIVQVFRGIENRKWRKSMREQLKLDFPAGLRPREDSLSREEGRRRTGVRVGEGGAGKRWKLHELADCSFGYSNRGVRNMYSLESPKRNPRCRFSRKRAALPIFLRPYRARCLMKHTSSASLLCVSYQTREMDTNLTGHELSFHYLSATEQIFSVNFIAELFSGLGARLSYVAIPRRRNRLQNWQKLSLKSRSKIPKRSAWWMNFLRLKFERSLKELWTKSDTRLSCALSSKNTSAPRHMLACLSFCTCLS